MFLHLPLICPWGSASVHAGIPHHPWDQTPGPDAPNTRHPPRPGTPPGPDAPETMHPLGPGTALGPGTPLGPDPPGPDAPETRHPHYQAPP